MGLLFSKPPPPPPPIRPIPLRPVRRVPFQYPLKGPTLPYAGITSAARSISLSNNVIIGNKVISILPGTHRTPKNEKITVTGWWNWIISFFKKKKKEEKNLYDDVIDNVFHHISPPHS